MEENICKERRNSLRGRLFLEKSSLEESFQSKSSSKSPVMPLSPTDCVISPCSRALLSKKGADKKTRPSFRKAALNNAMKLQMNQHSKMISSRLSREEEIRLRSSNTSRDGSLSPPNIDDLKESLFALPIRPKPFAAQNRLMVLGSSSSQNGQVLSEAGWMFEVVPPEEEEGFVDEGPEEKKMDIYDLVIHYAKRYVEQVSSKVTEPALVITTAQLVIADTNAERPERCLGLPATEDEARTFLETYSDSELKTVSSVVVTNPETKKQEEGIEVARIFFDEITDDMVERIISRPETFLSTGAFNINDPDIREAINHIDGNIDSVYGVPLNLLCELVEKCLMPSIEEGTQEKK